MRLARDCEEAWTEEESRAPETAEGPLGHPVEEALRRDRLPHIWCPGCGIGTAMGAFVEALGDAGVSRDRLAVVSGIGCSGRVSGYTDCDGFHTTHGRAIPFALGLHLANPSLEVVVFSGDGDLAAIGGNHLFHAARRNADITVLCVNNFNYGMTGGQHGPTSHPDARTATTPYGSIEPAFNLPHVVAAAGATYVARWTVLDLGRLRRSIAEALQHKGFAFVEILSPCPIYYGRFNRKADPLDELRSYRDRTEVRNFATLEDCALFMDGKIVVGKFVERRAPTLAELALGELPRRAQGTAGR